MHKERFQGGWGVPWARGMQGRPGLGSWIGDEKIEGRKCFDCWLPEEQLKQAVHPLQLQIYYKQLTDWSRISLTPFSTGAFLALRPECAPAAACTSG